MLRCQNECCGVVIFVPSAHSRLESRMKNVAYRQPDSALSQNLAQQRTVLASKPKLESRRLELTQNHSFAVRLIKGRGQKSASLDGQDLVRAANAEKASGGVRFSTPRWGRSRLYSSIQRATSGEKAVNLTNHF